MTTAPTEALKLYGTEQEAPAARTLRAGALSAELEAGKLRWIRYGGTEALRGIAFVVRGSGWETYAPEIANLEIEEGDGRFRVGYDARIESGDGVLAFRADIVAEDERSLVFTVEFRPETEFRTNRTGFVALHAIEGVAGEACAIIHSDGTVEETEFPGLIMPLQPFFDISAMRHQVSPGVWLTCRFEGADPWETEDQRNWTDASYKTYYRPLALPYPYTLAAGETLRQTATLTVEGGSAVVATAAGRDDGAVEIAVGGETGQHMPEIGLGVAASERDHLDHGLDLLRALGPGHLVCECDPRDDRSVETLAACRELAQALDAEVVLEIVVPCERPVADELATAAEIAGRAGLKPAAIVPEQARLLKFTLEKIPALGIPDFDEVYGAARAAFPGVRLGGGRLHQLHRAQPQLRGAGALRLPDACHLCRGARAGRPLGDGDAADAARHRRLGQGVGRREALPDRTERHRHALQPLRARCPPQQRQRALLLQPPGPAPSRASRRRLHARLCRAGGALRVEALALGAPSGALGMVYRRTGHPQPWFDDLEGPAVLPLYHIVSALAAAKGAAIRSVTSGDATRVLGLAYESDSGTLLWLANLSPETQAVTVSGIDGGTATIGRLDSGNFVEAVTDPAGFAAAPGQPGDPGRLELAPFAVARIEIAA